MLIQQFHGILLIFLYLEGQQIMEMAIGALFWEMR